MKTGFYGWIVFLTGFLFSFLAPASAHAGKRIILLETMPVEAVVEHSKACRIELERRGYSAPEYEVVVLKAEGSLERGIELLRAEAEQGQPALVLTFATLATQAAAEVFGNTEVPVVFSVVADPVGAGVIRAVGEPTGTNITGLVYSLLRETKIDLALQVVNPSKAQPLDVGCILSDYPSSMGDLDGLRAVSDPARIRFLGEPFPYRDMPHGLAAMMADAEQARSQLEDEVAYWWLSIGPMGEVSDLTTMLLADSAHPVLMGNSMRHVQDGAIMAVVVDYQAGGREAAAMADSILSGSDPGSVPVVAPRSFKIGLNLTTILEQGLVVPPALLELAKGNVYH